MSYFTPIFMSLLLSFTNSVQAFTSSAQEKPVPHPALELNFKVTKYQLKNGLTVILHVDRNAPLVNYQTWFKVGSKDDPPQRTGMAHLFEHLMFRGTQKRKGSEFIKDIEKKGISFNAYTSNDRTVYHFDLPKQELEFIAELEAERMHKLALTQENLDLEKEIVKEEYLLRYKNNPQNLWTDIFKLVFEESNYSWAVIGSPEDVNQTTPEDCQKFYKKYYSPHNTVLIVSGPIHIEKTKKIIQKHYGSLVSSNLGDRSYTKEPLQKKPRTKNLFRPVQSPSLALAYKTIPAGEHESYALDILGFILGGSPSSRLNRLLVEEKEESVYVYASNISLQNEGLFVIASSLHPNKKIPNVQSIITKEINKVRTQLVTPEELNRAQTHLMKDSIDNLKTVKGKANSLGIFETLFDDFSLVFKELDHYQKVTREDIQNVAQKFLNPHQLSLVNLHPKK